MLRSVHSLQTKCSVVISVQFVLLELITLYQLYLAISEPCLFKSYLLNHCSQGGKYQDTFSIVFMHQLREIIEIVFFFKHGFSWFHNRCPVAC